MNDFNNAYDAFQAAVKAVRKHGVKIAQGLRGDGCSCGCSGWKTPASWGDHENLTNYAFTRAGDVDWHERNNSYVNSKAYWNWSGKEDGDLSTGYILALTFTTFGFSVNWECSKRNCVTVDIRSWDASNVGVLPERPDAEAFILEVFTVGTALLAGSKAYADAQGRSAGEDVLDAIQSEYWDLSHRANRLRESAWLVEWSDDHDAELRGFAIASSGSMTDEDRAEAVAYLGDYIASA